MKKIIKLENLDCANCATNMENAINKVEGVENATVNFMTQKIKLELDEKNYDTIMKEIKKVCKKVEPDCTLVDE